MLKYFIIAMVIHCPALANLVRFEPVSIDLGDIEIGKIYQSSFVIKNQTRDIIEIDSFKSSCGCVKIQSQQTKILPGLETKVSFDTLRRYEGEFVTDILVLFKQGKPAKNFLVKGNAIQPLRAFIGWEEEFIQEVKKSQPVFLPPVNYEEIFPVIYISTKSDPNILDLGCEEVEIVSEFFILDKKSISREISQSFGSREGPFIKLSLRPKKELQESKIKDEIKLILKKSLPNTAPKDSYKKKVSNANSKELSLYARVETQIIHCYYAEKSILHLGDITQNLSEILNLITVDPNDKFPMITWHCKGFLSKVLNVEILDQQKNILPIKISIDKTKVKELPEGYLFANFYFTDEMNCNKKDISIIVDGFKPAHPIAK